MSHPGRATHGHRRSSPPPDNPVRRRSSRSVATRGPQTVHPTLIANLAPTLAGLFAFALYARTASPTITWANGGIDSGDYATAVATLGIAHPPGYPLYILLGQLFVRLPWATEPAGRLALMSAFGAALGIGLLVLASRRLVGELVPRLSANIGTLAAVAGIVALALAPIYWSQATVVQSRGLSALLRSLVVIVALAWWGTGDPRRRRWLGITTAALIGLATGYHLTNASLIWLLAVGFAHPRPADSGEGTGGPAFARTPWSLNALRGRLVEIVGWPATIGRWAYRSAAPVGIGAVAAVLAYGLPFAYLPIRAAAHPKLIWGDPSTPAGLLDIMSAKLYHGMVNDTYAGDRLRTAINFFVEQLGPLPLLLAAVGLVVILHRDRWLTLAILGPPLSVFLFYVLYNARDAEGYLVIALGMLALAASVGVGALVGSALALPARAWSWPLVASIILVAVGPSLVAAVSQFSRFDLSRDRQAEQYARFALGGMPPGALLISRSDEHTFSLWYVQDVLGVRPDVGVVDHHLLVHDWYVESIRRHQPTVSLAATHDLRGLVAANVGRRDVYITRDETELAGLLRQEGVVYRVIVPGR